MRTSKRASDAMHEARKKVRESTTKRKRRNTGNTEKSLWSPLRWVDDEYGLQGQVLFDGSFYWLVGYGNNGSELVSTPYSEEEWQKRKEKQ